MERLSELPKDMTFFTQITMEAAEDTRFLDAIKKARIKGALVGVEAVTPEGLKSVYKWRFQLVWRRFGKTAQDVLRSRRACSWFVHLRPAQRSPGHD